MSLASKFRWPVGPTITPAGQRMRDPLVPQAPVRLFADDDGSVSGSGQPLPGWRRRSANHPGRTLGREGTSPTVRGPSRRYRVVLVTQSTETHTHLGLFVGSGNGDRTLEPPEVAAAPAARSQLCPQASVTLRIVASVQLPLTSWPAQGGPGVPPRQANIGPVRVRCQLRSRVARVSKAALPRPGRVRRATLPTDIRSLLTNPTRLSCGYADAARPS